MTILQALSWASVALAVAGVIHVGLRPPFQRDLAALPGLRWLLLTAGTVGFGLAGWALVAVPVLLPPAAAASAAGMVFLWWRSRPGFGRSRRWPPGSLGILASVNAIDNRRFYLDQALRYGPVFKMSQFGRPVLCVVGLARGREFLQSHREALAGASLPYNRFIRSGMLRYMPSESHRAEAPLFRRAFGTVDLSAIEDDIRVSCRARLEMLSRGADHERVDLRPLIRAWTIETLARTFFGLQAHDPRVAALDASQRAMDLERTGGAAWRSTMASSFTSATSTIREAAADHRSTGDASSVLAALVTEAPESLDYDGRLRNLFVIFRLAIGDFGAALNWIAYQLSVHAEWQPRVREEQRLPEVDGTTGPDLATRVVLETLRLEQSEFLYRRTTRPIEFEGFHVPAGWLVRICVQESHRDPEVFPQPEAFNPDRFLARTYQRSEYATFGLDGHGCMGVDIVYRFGRVLVEEMCATGNWHVTSDSPPEHGTRHRHHWRPGRDWRVGWRPVE
jgi:cytochrome P450